MAALLAMAAQAHDKIKVACVGNSVTYGFLLPDREHTAYPARLQQLLGQDYEVGNFGRNSATLLRRGHLPYMEQQEFRNALAMKADRVVIHLGLNDTDPRNWPERRDDFVADYETLIDSFRTANPQCQIWICRPTPIFDRHKRFRSGTRDWLWKVREAVDAVALGRDVKVIDLYEPLHNRPDLFADALHPNAQGADILARIVYSALTGDYGGLSLPPVYTDSMVLQQGRPLTIAGRADAGQKVSVRIGRQKLTTTAADDGRWNVTLQPLQAGQTYTLEVTSARRTLTLRGIVAGEVWLCSGQSNMAFMLKQCATAREDIAQARRDDIRLFDMKTRGEPVAVEWPAEVLDSLNNLSYYLPTSWHTSQPATAADFSAVAWHFGRMLADSLHTPVGLILNAVGGSPAESWIDRRTLEERFPDILTDWRHNDFIQPWVRDRGVLNTKKTDNPLQRHPYEPCYLYETGIEPLEAFPVKGVIWYQGESNAHNMEAHEQLFRLLTESWRRNWHDAELPFYFVQLSSLSRPSWPWFRDSQRRLAESLPHCAMAVCSDLGDSLDVHPRHKREVGERLARLALVQTYGVPADRLTPSGPLFKAARFENGAARVSFEWGKGLSTSDGAVLRTFEVAGPDRRFRAATARVCADGTVEARSDEVSAPCYVRYGWQPFTRANLVNEAGLPASTFTTENP